MRIEVAEHAGVCYGVERALRLAAEASEGEASVHTLGPLIHNPQVVQSLRDRGVEVAESVEDATAGTLVIRSHGVDPAVIDEAVRRGLEVVDATCPFVSAAHQCARELVDGGYEVIVVGEADHPEVTGILAHAGGRAVVVEGVDDLPGVESRRVGIVVQTTQSLQRLNDVITALLPHVKELRVCNTICSATSKRQQSASELAGRVDAVVVVGGHNSGNTTRLAEISREKNDRVFHIETADEISPEWFEGVDSVGVTGGASTPNEQMTRVVEAIRALGSPAERS